LKIVAFAQLPGMPYLGFDEQVNALELGQDMFDGAEKSARFRHGMAASGLLLLRVQ
jgi:hypothetical protein